jgi:hypothetical protein
MMNETTHCLCCRVKLRYLDKEKARNRGYCSLRCFYTLPPRYAYIERIYGIKAIDFVKKELNRTDNVETVAGLIGVYKQSLYEFIKKHRIHRVVRWEG